MLIEIQCENVSSFDATVGKYVECGEKIIVSGDKAGETVECPKCNQPVEIPWPGRSSFGTDCEQPKRAEPIKAKHPTKNQTEGIRAEVWPTAAVS